VAVPIEGGNCRHLAALHRQTFIAVVNLDRTEGMAVTHIGDRRLVNETS
jgi:hypothetical protein